MDIRKPTRVRINQPSKAQEYHKYDGMVGIAINEGDNKNWHCDFRDIVRIYFTEGSILSMQINKNALTCV